MSCNAGACLTAEDDYTFTEIMRISCYDILDIVDPYLESFLAPKPYLKTSLPIGNNFFCGREQEIADIHDKLQNGTSFLMLHGIGGIGKSELAKHYAAGHSADYDAAVFVRFNKDIMHTGDLFNIIDHYYKEEISIDEVPIVWDMINAVQGHTMAIELIAKHMQMMKISPAEMQSLLAENGIAAGDKGRVRNFKDGHLKSETAYAHIAALFNIFGLSDDMKQVLRYSALLGPYAIDVDTYLDFVSLSDEEIITQDRLLKCGWLQIMENNEECYLTIHPLICDVICNELKPDIEHC